MHKYIKEYFGTDDVDEFTASLSPDVKRETAERRYYDLQKAFGPVKDIKRKVRLIIKKYLWIYDMSVDKQSFIEQARKIYPFVQEKSFKRYYCYYVKYVKDKVPVYGPIAVTKKKRKGNHYPATEKMVPNKMKMIDIEDMTRLGCKTSRDVLLRYGFKDKEINWLIDEGWDITV